jgi:hypothetical protein
MRTVLGALRWLALLVTGAALAFDVLVLAVNAHKIVRSWPDFATGLFFLSIGALVVMAWRWTWRWQPSRG